MSKTLIVRFLLFSAFLSLGLTSFSQSHFIGITAGRNRLDYLTGLEYHFDSAQHLFTSGLEFGISRTFGQRRLFPRMSIGYGYDFLAAEKVVFGPFTQYARSTIRLSTSSASRVNYNELLFGYFFEVGKKWKFTHRLQAGILSEGLKSQLSGEKELFWSIGYYASVGIKYHL